MGLKKIRTTAEALARLRRIGVTWTLTSRQRRELLRLVEVLEYTYAAPSPNGDGSRLMNGPNVSSSLTGAIELAVNYPSVARLEAQRRSTPESAGSNPARGTGT